MQEFAALGPYSTVIVLGKLQQSLYVIPLARLVFKLTHVEYHTAV
jgi:hypothetical protein